MAGAETNDRRKSAGKGEQRHRPDGRKRGRCDRAAERAVAVREPGSGRGCDDPGQLERSKNDTDPGRIEPARRKPGRKERQIPAGGEEERRVDQREPPGEGVVNDCRIRAWH
jgi:hypothetical protein